MKCIASQLTTSEFFPFFKCPTAKQKFTWNKFSTLQFMRKYASKISFPRYNWMTFYKNGIQRHNWIQNRPFSTCLLSRTFQTNRMSEFSGAIRRFKQQQKRRKWLLFAQNCSNWSRIWDDAAFSKVKFNDGIASKKQVSNCKKEIDYEIVFRRNCNYVSLVINPPDCSTLRQFACLEPFCFIENSWSSRMPKAPYSVRVSSLSRKPPLVCLSSSWFIF